MPATARTLFTEIIDYAGLFPPATLPMDEAFTRFLAHRNADDGWLLARFVCPAARLGELAPLTAAAELGGIPVRIAVLGSGGDDPPGFAAALERDTEAMTEFAHKVGGDAPFDVFEVRLPEAGDPAETIDYVCDQLAELGPRPPKPYVEVPLLGEWRGRVDLAARAAAVAGHEIAPARRVGLKIRCGGLDAAAVPTVEAVGTAITACRDFEVPLKATQGLHHPFRHHDAVLGTEVHGFVNLLAATLLAREHRLDLEDVTRIVADPDPSAFALTDDGLRWRGLEIVSTRIAVGRTDGFASFGSCSFTEPRNDLAGLGWL